MSDPWAYKLPQGVPVFEMDPKERFYRQFQSSVTTLQDQIAQLSSFSAIGGERQDAIGHVLAGISRLSNEVADASDYVPAYDQRTYSEAIKGLNEQLNTVTAQLAPKSGFKFKPRAAAAGSQATKQPDARHIANTPTQRPEGSSSQDNNNNNINDDSVPELPAQFHKNYNEELARPSASALRKPSFSAARDIAISDHAGLHIILPPTAARATSAGRLTGLRRCIVDMSVPTGRQGGGSPFANLAVRDVSDSLIVAGQVSGAAHITGVRGSVLVVAAGQVRMHECVDVVVYLWCGSRPIIEDCAGVRFAPIPEVYLNDRAERDRNQWDQVDDFKWLKDSPSPNWSVLPEAERLPESVWRDAVPGRPGAGLEDILKEVGIAARK